MTRSTPLEMPIVSNNNNTCPIIDKAEPLIGAIAPLSDRDLPAQNVYSKAALPVIHHHHNDITTAQRNRVPVGNVTACKDRSRWRQRVEKSYASSLNSKTSYVTVYDRGGDSLQRDGNDTCLEFDSKFESGNLDRAVRVFNREYPPPTNFSVMTPSQEYDLYASPDLYTHGNIQWYYYKVCVKKKGIAGVVRFNIRNMMKRDSLYNYGMLPMVYDRDKWSRKGFDVCYYQNTDKRQHLGRKKPEFYYTLSFAFDFSECTNHDVLYFAHCIPYTYSYLQSHLQSIEDSTSACKIFRRRTLCKTKCGNRCDLITITDGSSRMTTDTDQKKVIVLSARVHPGETNSSWIMHGVLDFLTSDDPTALALRSRYIFKIVPMLNPDGVIHGNYRCSLAGVDLNRRYNNTTYPSVAAMRDLLSKTKVEMYVDMHGHSRKKNMFMYGCKPYDDDNRLRLFPYLLSVQRRPKSNEMSSYFSFEDSTFSVSRSKSSTGRVVAWREMNILQSFTLEASFCSNGGCGDNLTQYNASDFIEAGKIFCETIWTYYTVVMKTTTADKRGLVLDTHDAVEILADFEERCKALPLRDEESSCGSDSDPSGDNDSEPERLMPSKKEKNTQPGHRRRQRLLRKKKNDSTTNASNNKQLSKSTAALGVNLPVVKSIKAKPVTYQVRAFKRYPKNVRATVRLKPLESLNPSFIGGEGGVLSVQRKDKGAAAAVVKDAPVINKEDLKKHDVFKSHKATSSGILTPNCQPTAIPSLQLQVPRKHPVRLRGIITQDIQISDDFLCIQKPSIK